jgi:cytochrome P450
MQDVEIGGKAIPKGSLVWLCIGSANRDESRWGGDASKLKLDRADVRKHVGFGTGRHQCIGLHLARAELRATVVNFLSRLENIRLADPSDPPEQLPLPYHRGVKNLKVRFDKLV